MKSQKVTLVEMRLSGAEHSNGFACILCEHSLTNYAITLNIGSIIFLRMTQAIKQDKARLMSFGVQYKEDEIINVRGFIDDNLKKIGRPGAGPV